MIYMMATLTEDEIRKRFTEDHMRDIIAHWKGISWMQSFLTLFQFLDCFVQFYAQEYNDEHNKNMCDDDISLFEFKVKEFYNQYRNHPNLKNNCISASEFHDDLIKILTFLYKNNLINTLTSITEHGNHYFIIYKALDICIQQQQQCVGKITMTDLHKVVIDVCKSIDTAEDKDVARDITQKLKHLTVVLILAYSHYRSDLHQVDVSPIKLDFSITYSMRTIPQSLSSGGKPTKKKYDKMLLKELQQLARRQKLTGFSRMNKQTLIDHLSKKRTTVLK
jgi:hypothetical protein